MLELQPKVGAARKGDGGQLASVQSLAQEAGMSHSSSMMIRSCFWQTV